jgi:hypothetical protein
MRSKSNEAYERNVNIEKRILSWHEDTSKHGVSNYPAFARVISIISKWFHNGMVGADAEWRNQHDGGYTFTSPKDAPHQKGYCWN